MNTTLLFTFLGLTFLFFLVMLFLVFKKVKSIDSQSDPTKKKNINSTLELLPFFDISNNVINLGNHNYRAIIECTSINYDLKTKAERDAIEASFTRFLNSLSYPISVFIMTKVIDNTNMLESIKTDYEKLQTEFPSNAVLKDYAENYYSEMSNLHNITNNNKIKKKYIIVQYNEALALTSSNDDEKYSESVKQIMNRCQIICSNLKNVGNISTKILSSEEIAGLLFSFYHRNEAPRDIDIKNGEFFNLIVKGNNKLESLSTEALFDLILCEAQHKLKNEIINKGQIDIDVSIRANKALKDINLLRKNLAGYFSTDAFNMSEDEGGNNNEQ